MNRFKLFIFLSLLILSLSLKFLNNNDVKKSNDQGNKDQSAQSLGHSGNSSDNIIVDYITYSDLEQKVENEVMSMYINQAIGITKTTNTTTTTTATNTTTTTTNTNTTTTTTTNTIIQIDQSFEIRSKCDNDNCESELTDDHLHKIITDITNKRIKVTNSNVNTNNKSNCRSSKLFDFNGLIQFTLIFIIMLMEIHLTHSVPPYSNNNNNYYYY